MLKSEIECGESKLLEFKEKLPSQSAKYIKTVISFSNAAGGKIIIGVENGTNAIVGVEGDIFQQMDIIANAIADSCEPMIIPDIYPATIGAKSIIVIEVSSGYMKPYYMKALGKEKGTYVRIGATTALADELLLKEMELTTRNLSYDLLPCREYEVSVVNIEKLCKIIYDAKVEKEDNKEVKAAIKMVTKENLLNWKLLRMEHNQYIATNAFAIALQEDNLYFSNSRVQCAVFKGNARTVFIDKKEYAGSVLTLIDKSFQFILNNLKIGLDVRGLYGHHVYEIDPYIIRELINNAFHHRSYLEDDAIQICIFDDFLEITSPGSLYGNLTVEQITQGRSRSRNKGLTRLFKEMGLIEEWGTGLQRVIEKCAESGLRAPAFIDMDTAFRVIVYRKKEPTVTGSWIVEDNNSQLIDEVLSMIRNNPKISQKALSNALQISYRKVQELTTYLQEQNYIKRIGSTRGIWAFVEK